MRREAVLVMQVEVAVSQRRACGRTPEEFAKSPAGDCGKDGGRAALENASRFPLSPSLDACGHQPGSAMLENQNTEEVSLYLD